jgi:hypothetical protein
VVQVVGAALRVTVHAVAVELEGLVTRIDGNTAWALGRNK